MAELEKMNVDPRLLRQIDTHPFPLLFATISGAHLYGFPSADSDYDLRGAHVLPLAAVVGLQTIQETIEKSGIYDGLEVDLVTHDAKKFFSLMLKKNGYVMEQLLSPLVVYTSPEHDELRAIARECLTKHHAHHYLGFAATQWKLFEKESPPRVKPLLYVYRVLLTGIHLMNTGVVEANLILLNEVANLSHVSDLIARKVEGKESGTLKQADIEFHQQEFLRLTKELEDAHERSRLPESARGAMALDDLLVRVRINGLRCAVSE
jgi:predicted nucleotidyltransferase